MKTNVVKGIVGGALILLITLGTLFATNHQANLNYLDQDSTKDNGTKAYFLLLKKIGYKTSSIKNFSAVRGQAIALNPNLDEQSAIEVLSWVKKGNSLLILSPKDNPLFKALHVKYKENFSLPKKFSLKKWDKEVFAGVNQIKMGNERRLNVDNSENEQVRILAEDEKGPWLIEIKRGKGTILILSETHLLTNKYIGQADNVILATNIIKRGAGNKFRNIYYFSKIDHINRMGPVGTMFTERWPLLMLQTLLLVFFLYYYWGKRFGKVLPLPERATDIGEYATSLANLYRYTKGRITMLDILNKDFRHTLLRYLNLPLYTTEQEMVARLKSDLRPANLSALKILQDTTEALNKQEISEHKLFSLVREMEQWRRENEDGNNN